MTLTQRLWSNEVKTCLLL